MSTPLSEAACSDPSRPTSNLRGAVWADGLAWSSGYNHWRAPNSAVPDCCSFVGVWKAARSRHPGGVNVLIGDGSVRFISETIDLLTWRGLGSRNGGEVRGAVLTRADELATRTCNRVPISKEVERCCEV